MTQIALQISPVVRGAYFHDYLEVAGAELRQVLGEREWQLQRYGALEFLLLDLAPQDWTAAARLSFVQGLYEVVEGGLRPLSADPEWRLHEDFVFGSKFRGKTNEHLTQMLLNVGLAASGHDSPEGLRLLDPMCGRGTTLLWGMRYGMRGRGIEQDPKALADLSGSLKKWCKLHRVKHHLRESAGQGRRRAEGRFLEFQAADTGLRLYTGDAREAGAVLGGERFDLIVSDLPYGVQHHTTAKTRNPLAVLEDCVAPWRDSLRPGGVIVLAFNSYMPRRDALVSLFEAGGLQAEAFSARHRMSESIVRDVVLFRPTGTP